MPRQPKPWYRKQDGWWYTTINGQQVKLAEGRSNHKAAQQEFHRLLGQNVRRGEMDSKKISVLLERYLEHSHKTQSKEIYLYKVNILSQLADHINVQCQKLIPNHISAWIETQDHWGSNMRSHAVGVIKACFNWGYREGLLSSNPIRTLKKPPRTPRVITIDTDVYKAILAATDEPFGEYLTALWKSGARPGEVAGLTAENYDPERRCWVITDHKTKKHIGAKTIWIPPELADLTEKLIEKYPTGALFRNTIGTPWTSARVWGRLSVLKKKLELKGKIMAYATRHTFATNAVAKGIDSVVLAKLLGHTTTNTIMRTYVHPKDDHMIESVSRIVEGE